MRLKYYNINDLKFEFCRVPLTIRFVTQQAAWPVLVACPYQWGGELLADTRPVIAWMDESGTSYKSWFELRNHQCAAVSYVFDVLEGEANKKEAYRIYSNVVARCHRYTGKNRQCAF